MTLLLLSFTIIFQTTMTPEQVVQKQLDAYNNRDITGFMSTMDDEVALYNFSDGRLLAQGFDDVKAIYNDLFDQSPKLHSTLTNRIVLGHQVIDHETITGRMGNDDAIELVVIYEVKDDKIFKITVLRP